MSESTGENIANHVKLNSSLLFLDVTFNDFDYKHINQIEVKIKDNNTKYRSAAVERYRAEIDILNLDKSRLEAAQNKLEEQTQARMIAEERLQEKLKALEMADQAKKERIKGIITIHQYAFNIRVVCAIHKLVSSIYVHTYMP